MVANDFGLNPYVELPTRTLYNKLDIHTPQQLKEAETEFARIRTLELRERPIEGNFDLQHLKQIHGHMFQDVYQWAGQARENFDAAKQEHVGGPAHKFTPSADIEKEASRVFTRLAQEDHLKGLPRDEFIAKAARLHNDINQLHVFPEGNGRAQREFLQDLSAKAGHPMDLSIGTQERIVQASIAGSKGDHAPMERLMTEASDPARAQSVKTAITFLEQNWGKENVAGAYIAATTSGQTYDGTLVGRSGNDFLFREQNNFLLVGNSMDIPNLAKSGDRFEFTASDGPVRQQQQTAQQPQPPMAAQQIDQSGPQYDALRKAMPGETAGYEWKRESGDVQTYRHTQTQGYLHIDSKEQFHDRHAEPISRSQALESARHRQSVSQDVGESKSKNQSQSVEQSLGLSL